MLEIFWRETDAKGYTDSIPLEWLADEGTRSDATHEMIGPRGCYVLSCGGRLMEMDVPHPASQTLSF